ncbi:DUF3499 domain-containing protein [Nocardioides zeae]|uniref:DUF3499 domain-containing protein n=1 Tax=Nocardioides imazamoxiresistens TaxID=3231893 RepID=A0ABU3Q091_9ACTN|nr:DUF3499 domain-containing protein [Nocardioides zeae]MDT9594926.1 DUF3499 domain-containing protein [Nocardioides zeae]
MRSARRCSRTACGRAAVMTLTYVYADQTAVLGPLSTTAEPHAYDLCEQHSERLSAPRGWEVLRLASAPVAPGPSDDDLLALADAVREAAVRPAPTASSPHLVESVHTDAFERVPRPDPFGAPRADQRPEAHRGQRPARRNHLRVLDTDPTLG